MDDIFLKIVNMSISACWIVFAIILLRIVLKKAPKWVNCVLWGIAGLRLIMPFSFESIFSLIPSAETITKTPDSPRPHIDSGVPVIDNQVNGYLQGNYFEGVTRPMGNFVDITTILAIVWVIGIAALLIYTLVSFLRLKGKIGTAVLLRDNIYQSEAVASPFVLGIIKPKIYLPFNMNSQDMEHVIAHEQAHIRRKDHLWKPLGFLILTLHWFNPMVWLGYILLCRDIELACDEKVVKELNNEQRADYSEALLACSVNRRMIAACPIAFGEVGVKDRVKSVLNYKKPAFWIIMVAIIASIAVAVCFLTNPKSDTKYKEYYDSGYSLQVVVNTYTGTTQLPDKTETFIFDVLNGTEGELPNGTQFVISECNLQQGSLTIQLTGAEVFPVEQIKREQAKEIIVWEDSVGVELVDANYMNFLTFSFIQTQSIDEAVSMAILDDNKEKYYNLGTECATEGHIIYGTDVNENIYTVYVLTEYNHFGFMNGYFVSQSGGRIPAVMTFEKTTVGYKLLNVKYAEDGSRHVPSIKEMFPKKYQYRVMNPTEKDYESLWTQCTVYAQAYLDEIGRTEEIRNYSQVEHILLTDMGVSVEVSNKILEYNLPYNYDVGYYEAIEDNVRYVYRMTYEKEQNRIICTKEKYETKEVVEKIIIDSLTGEIISK